METEREEERIGDANSIQPNRSYPKHLFQIRAWLPVSITSAILMTPHDSISNHRSLLINSINSLLLWVLPSFHSVFSLYSSLQARIVHSSRASSPIGSSLV